MRGWHTPTRNPEQPNTNANVKGATSLMEQALDWRTPTAQPLGTGEHMETNQTIDGTPPELGRRVYNRNGKLTVIDLNRQVAMTDWATPNTMTGGQTSRGGDRKDEKLLGGQVRAEWPTPNSHDETGARGQGFAATDGHYKPHDLPSAVLDLWPTVTARDCESPAKVKRRANATPGGTPLVLAVQNWPTPDTVNRKSQKAMTASTDNGRRSGGGNSSPPGLEQVAELAEGILPPEIPESSALPPKTRALIGSLWPTPTVQDSENTAGPSQFDRNSQPLNVRVHTVELPANWPTPTGLGPHDSLASAGRPRPNKKTALMLPDIVGKAEEANWPTPTEGDAKASGSRIGNPNTNAHPGVSLTDATVRAPAGRPDPASINTDGKKPASSRSPSRGQLNSRWVAQLQGFPSDWCELSPLDLVSLMKPRAHGGSETKSGSTDETIATLSARSATRSSPKSPK